MGGPLGSNAFRCFRFRFVRDQDGRRLEGIGKAWSGKVRRGMAINGFKEDRKGLERKG